LEPNEPMPKYRRTGFHSVFGSSSVSKGMASMCATLYVGASFGPVMAAAFR